VDKNGRGAVDHLNKALARTGKVTSCIIQLVVDLGHCKDTPLHTKLHHICCNPNQANRPCDHMHDVQCMNTVQVI
jgi:hypothetical protein